LNIIINNNIHNIYTCICVTMMMNFIGTFAQFSLIIHVYGLQLIPPKKQKDVLNSLLIHVYGLQLDYCLVHCFLFSSLLIHVYGLQQGLNRRTESKFPLTTYTCIWVATTCNMQNVNTFYSHYLYMYMD